MRCLNGLELPNQGHIHLFGTDLLSAKSQQRRDLLNKIGTVFQACNLLSRRTVLENIALPLEWQGVDLRLRLKKAEELAQIVGLSDKKLCYPSELSGGQQQRVAIARALATGAPLLLCDEFTSALDPETSLEILALLRDLNKSLKVTVILITHDMTVVRESCDQVIVLHQGEVVEQGLVSEILLTPKHDVTRSLVSGLFIKELPHFLLRTMKHTSIEGGQVILRLIFSEQSAKKPIISNLVHQFDIPANIIAGSLDHIREVAFGSLIITLPYNEKQFLLIQEYLTNCQVASDVLGYIQS